MTTRRTLQIANIFNRLPTILNLRSSLMSHSHSRSHLQAKRWQLTRISQWQTWCRPQNLLHHPTKRTKRRQLPLLKKQYSSFRKMTKLKKKMRSSSRVARVPMSCWMCRKRSRHVRTPLSSALSNKACSQSRPLRNSPRRRTPTKFPSSRMQAIAFLQLRTTRLTASRQRRPAKTQLRLPRTQGSRLSLQKNKKTMNESESERYG